MCLQVFDLRGERLFQLFLQCKTCSGGTVVTQDALPDATLCIYVSGIGTSAAWVGDNKHLECSVSYPGTHLHTVGFEPPSCPVEDKPCAHYTQTYSAIFGVFFFFKLLFLLRYKKHLTFLDEGGFG